METTKLYVVNYCERITLDDHETIKTHSIKKAIEFAKYLKNRDDVLYAQIVTYRYNKTLEAYQFITLQNYYK